MACNCLKQEVGQGSGTVKGYITTVECDECKAKREADAIESAKKRRRQEILVELNQLDLKVIRPLLDEETERINEIKAQKTTLREELANLSL